MPSAEMHLLIGPPLDWSTSRVACAARAAQHATWDPTLVTCGACVRLARPPCTCGPLTPPCPACSQGKSGQCGPAPPKALRTEKQFQEALRQLAVAHGWLYFHVWDSRKSPPGFVDTVLVHPARGLAVFAELKLPGKLPTPPQQMWLDALRQVERVVTRLWRPEDWGEIEEMIR